LYVLSKEETDKEVMNMHAACESYIKNLKEYSRDIQSRYMTRRISFFNRDIAENLYSLGYVETVTQQEGVNGSSGRGSFFSDDEIIDEKYETLEMQLKQIGPRRNVPIVRKSKFSHSSIPIKLTSKSRFKSIIEPRKFFQPYKIIGCEGEEISEFKHPLGKFISDLKI
jgi:hypothetical protein